MRASNVNQKCINYPHSGPVGCHPAPNILHLANEFAKGKMFWNGEKFGFIFGIFSKFDF